MELAASELISSGFWDIDNRLLLHESMPSSVGFSDSVKPCRPPSSWARRTCRFSNSASVMAQSALANPLTHTHNAVHETSPWKHSEMTAPLTLRYVHAPSPEQSPGHSFGFLVHTLATLHSENGSQSLSPAHPEERALRSRLAPPAGNDANAQALFASPSSPTNEARHAPHVWEVVPQPCRFKRTQFGADVQLTTFKMALAVESTCFVESELPKLKFNWLPTSPDNSAVVTSSGKTTTVVTALDFASNESYTVTVQVTSWLFSKPPGGSIDTP